MLPFRPEPIEELKARYPAALRKVFDCTKGVPRPRPGELYSHVFDFKNGLRLIVSRDKESVSAIDFKSGHRLTETFLHVSASFVEGTEIWRQLRGAGESGQKGFLILVKDHYAEISGDDQPLEFHGFSADKLVPHWRRKETA